ncbi:hypothetical protein Trydic_g13836 [Trypoxylus dichotomus]
MELPLLMDKNDVNRVPKIASLSLGGRVHIHAQKRREDQPLRRYCKLVFVRDNSASAPISISSKNRLSFARSSEENTRKDNNTYVRFSLVSSEHVHTSRGERPEKPPLTNT